MHRFPPIAAATLALLLGPAWAVAQGVTVAVWPTPSGGTVGDTIVVELRVLNPATPFNAFEAALDYDPAALQFVPRPRAEQEGSSMRNACGSTFYQFNAAGDSLEIYNSLLCNQRALVGEDTLLRVRFVLVGHEQQTWIRFSRLVAYDDGLFVLPAIGVDAPVWIITSLGVGHGESAGSAHIGVSPNPAAGTVEFSLDRGTAGPGDLFVVDLAGRVVRRLIPGDGPTVHMSWDGRGDDGRSAPPGVYCAVFRGAGQVASTRFVRVR